MSKTLLIVSNMCAKRCFFITFMKMNTKYCIQWSSSLVLYLSDINFQKQEQSIGLYFT